VLKSSVVLNFCAGRRFVGNFGCGSHARREFSFLFGAFGMFCGGVFGYELVSLCSLFTDG